ncbi:MAG: UpxY family transcription antiterminator [Bacteroidales bacterium]|nr:UpxY family transcription antiterminator [Bacteroidales bacterium]
MEKDPHWYVAFVKSCQERKAAEMLEKNGVECYVPIQKIRKKWSDRWKVIDRLVLPHLIFIRCHDYERIEVIQDIPNITKYMSAGGSYNPVVVPDTQMDVFRMMVDNFSEEVQVQDKPLAPGDWVEIISGPMKGKQCELIKVDKKTKIAVRLQMLGTATVEISADMVRKIEKH